MYSTQSQHFLVVWPTQPKMVMIMIFVVHQSATYVTKVFVKVIFFACIEEPIGKES